MTVNHEYIVDIQSPVVLGAFGYDIVKGDAESHLVQVTLLDNGTALNPLTANLYVVRLDGETVTTAMNVTDNVCSVAMPVEDGAITGRIYILVKASTATETLTVLAKYATVKDGITDVIVDPGDTIPSIDALLAQIAAMEAATADAASAAAAITGITAEAETLENSSVPTAAAEIDPGDGHINLSLGFPRPPKAWYGTLITGASDVPAVYATGISIALANDTYVNTDYESADYGNVYTCSLSGNAATALWAYTSCNRGAAGSFENNLGLFNVLDYGVLGNGSDETTAVQACLTAAATAHGVFHIPAGLTVTCDSIALTGKSFFGIDIQGTIRRKNAGATNNGLLHLISCTDVYIKRFDGDGNIANNGTAPTYTGTAITGTTVTPTVYATGIATAVIEQIYLNTDTGNRYFCTLGGNAATALWSFAANGGTLNEFQHLLKLNSCNRIYCDNVYGKDPGGDVVYANNVFDLTVGRVEGIASNTGRQTFSCLQGARIRIGYVKSIGVGYHTMPGGVDFEPESVNQPICDVVIDGAYIESIGTNALSFSNNFGTGCVCNNITVKNAIVHRRTQVGTTSGYGLYSKGFNHVNIQAIVTEDNATPANLRSTGVYAELGNDVKLDVQVFNVYVGGRFTGVDSLVLSGSIADTAQNGAWYINLTNSTMMALQTQNVGISNAGCIQAVIDGTSTSNLRFLDCRFERGSNDGYGVRFTSASIAENVKFERCPFVGWSSSYPYMLPYGSFAMASSSVKRSQCEGINYAGSIPTAGIWWIGEYVENTAPAVVTTGGQGTPYIVRGWRRITNSNVTGTTHVINVDWVEERALTSNAAWTTWNPTLTWGTADPASVTTVGRYKIVDNVCFFNLMVSSADGNAASSLSIAVPATPKDNNSMVCFAAQQLVDTTWTNPMAWLDDDSGGIVFRAFSVATDGTALTVIVSGQYEIA